MCSKLTLKVFFFLFEGPETLFCIRYIQIDLQQIVKLVDFQREGVSFSGQLQNTVFEDLFSQSNKLWSKLDDIIYFGDFVFVFFFGRWNMKGKLNRYSWKMFQYEIVFPQIAGETPAGQNTSLLEKGNYFTEIKR